jgi:general nucleoside transport system ATP-binding protein
LPLLQLASISKRFGSTRALDDVSLVIEEGEVVALVGENGAGKSTLMNIAAGALRADSGAVSGSAIHGQSVAMVHQHFNLVDAFTIAENLVLSRPDAPAFHTASTRMRSAAASLAASGIELPELRRTVESLSVGEKAQLEFARALAREPSLLILDEPTAVLTREESEDLQRVIASQRDRGRSVVLITHKVAEVFRLASRIVVLRRGSLVLDRPAALCTPDSVAEAMLGRSRRLLSAPAIKAGDPVLTLRDTSTRSRERETALGRCNLVLRRGEITAVLGVSGNGQRSLARLLRGIIPPSSGTIELDGRRASRATLSGAKNVAHIPEDRTTEGLIAAMSIEDNIRVALDVDATSARRIAREIIERFDVRASSTRQAAGSLSGGNQQKVLIGRELARNPTILIAAEPTRGLDFEVSRIVREAMLDIAARGCAVLLITSDIDEAFEIASSFHTIYDGRLSEVMARDAAESTLARSFGGLS